MDFNLRERTVVILGPFSSVVQNLTLALTAQGADVALVDSDAQKASKFCQNVNDMREVNDKNGRAAAIEVNLKNEASLKDGLGKAAQTFGSIDVLIDAMMINKAQPFSFEGDLQLDDVLTANLKISLQASQFVVNFLKGRKRGRIVYLMNDSFNRGLQMDALGAATRTGLQAFAKAFARQVQEHNITVNCVSLGLTEEYLLQHFPECGSMKEAQEKMKAFDPMIRITEPDKVTNSVLFLCSNLGLAVTGQHLALT